MEIAFCCDRGVLAALHVAALSVLQHFGANGQVPRFRVFSDELDERDGDLLRETLESSGRPFHLEIGSVDPASVRSLPRLTGSLAAYYRLLIPEQMDGERYLYLDVDTLCRVDLADLAEVDLAGCPIGLCAEAPLNGCADRSVVEALGPRADGTYFNSGVMVVDRQRWLDDNLTSRFLDLLSSRRLDYFDQSAINIGLFGNIARLAPQYNCYTNVRANWPRLIPPASGDGQLLHFTDYPKPWSRFGRVVHPFGETWWGLYHTTEHFRKCDPSNLNRRFRREHWSRYRKVLKDKILFSLYSGGWFRPKGVSEPADDVARIASDRSTSAD